MGRGAVRRLILAVSITAGVAVVAPPPAAVAGPNCDVTAADHEVDSVETQLLGLINDYRLANGRSKLIPHNETIRASAWFSRDMATLDYIPANHVDSNSRDPGARLTWCGSVWSAYAENLAAGTSGDPTEVFNGWKNSPVHNTNMLSTGVTHVGIARAFNAASTYDWYWTLNLVTPTPVPKAADHSDYDGDGKADIAVWRGNPGVWYVSRSTGGSSATSWGDSYVHDDVPVPADYDADGKTDIAVWRPNPGVWYVKRSSNDTSTATYWGDRHVHGDIPVPGDYDGDARADLAVWRPGPGLWYILRSSDGGTTVRGWGDLAHDDVPVPADYDGDRKTDIAVWRPNPGIWYIVRSSDGATTATYWGDRQVHADTPLPADYDGDGKADIAVWRGNPGVWYVKNSSGIADTARNWGDTQVHNDVPVPADYDGDNKTDLAVWRPNPGYWYILKSTGSSTGFPWGDRHVHDDIVTGLPFAIRQTLP